MNMYIRNAKNRCSFRRLRGNILVRQATASGTTERAKERGEDDRNADEIANRGTDVLIAKAHHSKAEANPTLSSWLSGSVRNRWSISPSSSMKTLLMIVLRTLETSESSSSRT